MFWKIVRWGGTAVVVVVLALAAVGSQKPAGETADQAAPAPVAGANKSFNVP